MWILEAWITFVLWFEDALASMALTICSSLMRVSTSIDLMNGKLLEPVEQIFMDQQHPVVFRSDNAPCHRVMSVLVCMVFKNIDRRKMLCPPQSPDRMKKDTWEVKPTTCKEIKAAIFRISDIIRPAKIRTVFSSLLRRAAAMIGSRSYSTKY